MKKSNLNILWVSIVVNLNFLESWDIKFEFYLNHPHIMVKTRLSHTLSEGFGLPMVTCSCCLSSKFIIMSFPTKLPNIQKDLLSLCSNNSWLCTQWLLQRAVSCCLNGKSMPAHSIIAFSIATNYSAEISNLCLGKCAVRENNQTAKTHPWNAGQAHSNMKLLVWLE